MTSQIFFHASLTFHIRVITNEEAAAWTFMGTSKHRLYFVLLKQAVVPGVLLRQSHHISGLVSDAEGFLLVVVLKMGFGEGQKLLSV